MKPGGRASLISLTSVGDSSGTRVVRKAKRSGWRAARAKTSPRRAEASASVAAPPVTRPYLANGALTSTENRAPGRRSSTAATTSGRMPLVSILTSGPRAASSAAKADRPGTRVGSPPVTTKPSSHLAWEAAKERTEAPGSGLPAAKAREALWQWGQRRLQPPKKSTAESFPGQSQKDMGSMPRTSSQAGENVIFTIKPK